MRAIFLVAGAALALSACGGGNTEANEVNTLTTDNMMVDSNAMMAPGDMANMDTMDPNMAMDANMANMMAEDMNTNSPDTNLANGM